MKEDAQKENKQKHHVIMTNKRAEHRMTSSGSAGAENGESAQNIESEEEASKSAKNKNKQKYGAHGMREKEDIAKKISWARRIFIEEAEKWRRKFMKWKSSEKGEEAKTWQRNVEENRRRKKKKKKAKSAGIAKWHRGMALAKAA